MKWWTIPLGVLGWGLVGLLVLFAFVSFSESPNSGLFLIGSALLVAILWLNILGLRGRLPGATSRGGIAGYTLLAIALFLAAAAISPGATGREGRPAATPTPTIVAAGQAAQPTPAAKEATAPPAKATPTTRPTATLRPSTPTATTIVLPKLGETFAKGNWEYTVTKVERQKTLVWSEFGNKEDALGEWLIVYITLKNIGKENFPINTWDFELHASGDIKYKHTDAFEASMWRSKEKLADLMKQFPPGIEVKTALVFDIAPDAKDLKLWLAQPKQYITLE